MTSRLSRLSMVPKSKLKLPYFLCCSSSPPPTTSSHPTASSSPTTSPGKDLGNTNPRASLSSATTNQNPSTTSPPNTSAEFSTRGAQPLEAYSTAESSSRGGENVARSDISAGSPDHLVVLVHGIMGTVKDWSYVSDQLSVRLGKHFLVYASSSNESLRTLQGIDRSGERLADELREVVNAKPGLKHISMVAHSLGGLIARYSLALLFQEASSSKAALQDGNPESRDQGSIASNSTIAGLQPACFITLATPHLGVRGKGQLPFLLGVDILERIAAPVAPLLVGRTGRQLFLTDGDPSTGTKPLLLRMASPQNDKKDLPFLASLGAFHTRVAYANAGFDHMVGWQTSSIRRSSELPQVPKKSISPLYKHVMLVENCPSVPLKNTAAMEADDIHNVIINYAQGDENSASKSLAFSAMQEQMLQGLQSLAWRKVDVSFREGFFPFFAHNNIHVKLHWIHFDGAGVVRHLADTIQELESLYLMSRM